MITNRMIGVCFVALILNISAVWYFHQQEQKRQHIASLAMDVKGQFYGINYYGSKVNFLSSVVDQYECKRAHQPYTGQSCSDKAPDATEIQDLGQDLFTGIVADYKVYQQYGVASVKALDQLIPYENAEYKTMVNNYQQWFIQQQKDSELPVQEFAAWEQKFDKVLGDI